jgi:rfaE bifunctional protein kinase chain/domain
MNNAYLEEVIRDFSKRVVYVIGDCMLDKSVFGQSRFKPENRGVPNLKANRTAYAPGGAANVAANVAALGAKRVYLFGAIGNDDGGRILTEEVEKREIEFVSLLNGPTIIKMRLYEQERNHNMFSADFGEEVGVVRELNPALQNELFLKLRKKFDEEKPDIVLMSDYNKGVLSGDLAPEVIKLCRRDRHSISVFGDCKPVNIRWFTGLDGLKVNEEEARAIAGGDYAHKSIDDVLIRLEEISLAGNVIITRGPRGMAILSAGQKYEIPTRARAVSDVVGAGDTVNAVLGLAYTSGANLVDAAHLANYAAGVVVEKLGTSTLTREELIDRMRLE